MLTKLRNGWNMNSVLLKKQNSLIIFNSPRYCQLGKSHGIVVGRAEVQRRLHNFLYFREITDLDPLKYDLLLKDF